MIQIKIFKDGKYWSSTCPLLDVHSYGDTPEEAEKNLLGAIKVMFQDLIEDGKFEEYLKGIVKVDVV